MHLLKQLCIWTGYAIGFLLLLFIVIFWKEIAIGIDIFFQPKWIAAFDDSKIDIFDQYAVFGKIAPAKAVELSRPYLLTTFQMRKKWRGGWEPQVPPAGYVFQKGKWYYIIWDNYPDKMPSYRVGKGYATKVHVDIGDVIRPFSKEDEERGWYWGTKNARREGTPETWEHVLEGTRSANWQALESGTKKTTH